MRINIKDLPWSDVLKQVGFGECTPFVGAGACAGVLPLAAKLAQDLIAEDESEFERRCPLPDRTNLARVCQYLAVTHRNSAWPKQRIAEKLNSLGQPDFTDPCEPHRMLADLTLPIYLTTNYDDFLRNAIRPTRPTVRREFARWQATLLKEEHSSFDDGYRPTSTDPVVFHLHGNTEYYRGMVATEDDYLDFLVNISKDVANSPAVRGAPSMLPLPIRRAVTNNILLFVGYGLEDINFRVILRGLVGSLERSQRIVNIAIQYSGDNSKELEDYLEEYFKWTLDLWVFWGTARDFTTEMRSRWQDKAKK